MSVQSVPLKIRAIRRDDDQTVRWSWMKAMLLGEFVGFIPPAIAGTLAYRAGAPDWAMLPILAAAGSLEGAALGYAQSTVLDREIAGFPRWRWVGATAAAAAGAWALGMIPSASGTFAEDHPMIIAAGAVVLAPVLPNSIGLAQWLVLRHRVPGAGRWIPANAIA